MADEEIIKEWRSGLTTTQVAKVYMTAINSNLKKDEKKITKVQALAYIEPIIFKYETEGWKYARKV